MTISTYEKVRDLGKVPLGRAWIGRDASSDLTVVVKRIPLEAIGGGGNGWTRLVDETRALLRIGHAQIAATLEVAEEGNDLVMVTERPAGKSVADLVGERGKLDVEDLKRWIVPVIEGLAIAHDSGVVHRHIHEKLIFVDDEGAAVLTGFALTLDQRVDPDPIPPELLSGNQATPGSDQFLVGAMLRRLARSAPHVPALDIVISRAMQGDPHKRFPDLIDMMQVLEQVLEGAADEARRPKGIEAGPCDVEQPPQRQQPALEGRKIEHPPSVEAASPSDRRGRGRRFAVPLAAAVVVAAAGLAWLWFSKADEAHDTWTPPVVSAARTHADDPMTHVSELLADGQLEEAALELEMLLADGDLADPAPALDALGTIRLQEGRGGEAADLFQRALARQADEGLYYKLSLAQALAGDDDLALQTVAEGLRLYPDSERLMEAKFHLGGA